MKEVIDTCVAGNGVVCGTEVHVNPDCSIDVSEGTVILPDGTILHTPEKKFRYYVKPLPATGGDGEMDTSPWTRVSQFMLTYLKLDKLDPKHMEFLLLAPDDAPPDSIDSLKQQHPDDIPERNLNRDKIMLLLALSADTESGLQLYWILVTRNAMARAAGIEAPAPDDDQSLFSNNFSPDDIDIPAVDRFLRPVLQLPLLSIPRFGYKKLAIINPAIGLKEANLQAPFQTVKAYADIFFEYKAIIDDYQQEFRDALKLLHDLFGPLLSHKDAAYLEKYRKMLALKLNAFYEEGMHLYYIQYVYDWLRDLTTAYNELVLKLNGFRGKCTCSTISESNNTGLVVLLGPVLGGRSTYQPLIFRDLALAAERDAVIREVRCMHWRIMVMIRTFDLPFLHLEKVLATSNDTIEDKLDSTDYWESQASPDTGNPFQFLPIKLTPTRSSAELLGKTAIPYYYPLDANSVYSVHQFWDYETTVLRRTDTLLSYNAFPGNDDKASTDVSNDSYSTRPEVLMPLAFNFEPRHWLRVEGHIGRPITLNNDNKDFRLNGFDLARYLMNYNICIDVIAVNVHSTTNVGLLPYVVGLEHRPALQQGQTLVLVYTDTDEQIELNECIHSDRAEISAFTIVGDFMLPYRVSCCGIPDVDYYLMIQQPQARG
ncbi:MAG: hypothetical protein J7623_22230 [Chitinophaga sp.]|uniref:hypothetical protein n=1 Tax=Chitinophaga sp. TaxID=1869181 RepID=UPI001B249B87|nr:hypothetical protein [Chitinophaga sp.]MBO9731374.1 hypothetical protein [Chitinophaga sp.]